MADPAAEPITGAARMNPTPADRHQPNAEPQQTHAVGEFKHTSPLLAAASIPADSSCSPRRYDNTIQRWQSGLGQGHAAGGSRQLGAGAGVSSLGQHALQRRLRWPRDLVGRQRPRRRSRCARSKPISGWVRAVAVSPDGKLLATCGNDNLVKLWNAADGTPLGECFGHANHVYNVAFHPDGRRLVSGDLKGVVREWDLASGEQLRQFDAEALWKYDAGFRRRHRRRARHGLQRRRQAAGLRRHQRSLQRLCRHRQSAGRGVRLRERARRCNQHGHRGQAQGAGLDVRFHRDGFVIGSQRRHDGGHLLFWKTEQPNEFFDFKLPDLCRDLDLHADQLRLATSHDDKTLRLWQMTAKATCAKPPSGEMTVR